MEGRLIVSSITWQYSKMSGSPFVDSADPTAHPVGEMSLIELGALLRSSVTDVVECAGRKWVRTVKSLGCDLGYTGFVPKFKLPDGAILERTFGVTQTYHDGKTLWVLMDPDDKIVDADDGMDDPVGVFGAADP